VSIPATPGQNDLFSRSADQFTYAQPFDSLGGLYTKIPGGNIESLGNPLIDI
jgi:hypothetical protein